MTQPLLKLPDEAATCALGVRAAVALPAADQPFVVELRGELGAGKTTFARALLHALGVTGRVRSPSYALLECYTAGAWQALHLDLYRLSSADELEMLGLRDYHQGRTLWLVEWPEKGRGYLPAADAVLHFEVGADGHRVGLAAGSPAGSQWIGNLMPDLE